MEEKDPTNSPLDRALSPEEAAIVSRKRSRVAAHLKIEADGSLAGEPLPEDPSDERAGLHSENQTVIYPSDALLYPHSSVVRLYK